MHKPPYLETSKAARRTAMPSGNGKNQPAAKPAPVTAKPDRFTYALSAFSAEIRDQGWYVARTVPSFTGEKPKWSGPFETIESACLSIGRHCATEIADRHTRSAEFHKIKRGAPLYGLKVTTRLKAR